MKKSAVNKIIFIGSKSFGLETLKKIYSLNPRNIDSIISLDDRNDRRSRYQEILNFSIEKEIDFFTPSKNEFHSIICKRKPNICFVNGWYNIIKKETLKIPNYGFIGVHHSLLPKYRGGSPLVWQLLNREKIIGSTILFLEESVDSGKIIVQVSTKNKNYTINKARKILEEKILEKMESVWPLILQNKTQSFHQNDTDASYCTQLRQEDCQINWNKRAIDIISQINAQTLPYPCAYTIYKERKIKIVSAIFFKQKLYSKPGKVVFFEKKTGNPVVSCRNGEAIIIRKILLENKRIVAAKKKINSTNMTFESKILN